MSEHHEEAPSLTDAIDTLANANSLVEAAFMAASELSQRECDAIQQVLDVAQSNLRDVKATLYAIHDAGKGGAA